jgi:hypothetical protein
MADATRGRPVRLYSQVETAGAAPPEGQLGFSTKDDPTGRSPACGELASEDSAIEGSPVRILVLGAGVIGTVHARRLV